MEHQLKMYPLAEPVVNKRRHMAPEGRIALKEKVFRWLKERLIRKNSAATLQRMMEKVLADQRGRNVEIHLEEVIDPITYSFGVKEGKFFGHMVTEEGLKADPKRILTIILSPTPRSPNQIRSLLLQLIATSKFIPKLAELKHPICEARTRMETAKGSGWTNEA
ncbi:hypothetical protein Tco_0368949 [Tanacetum coccineum]